MPRRKPRYPEKPWHPDHARWRPFMEKDTAKRCIPEEPKGGWQLWDWRTLKDVPQNERV